jgi:hypothetical protein
MTSPLTPQAATTLDLAARTFAHESSREAAVWSELQVSLPVFWARVSRLLDTEEALAHNPVHVNRLHSIRGKRLRTRRR